MSQHSHDIQTPKPVLFAVAALLTFVTAFVGFARLTGIGIADMPSEPLVDRIEVRFLDQANGAVGAFNPTDDVMIHLFEAGEGGFVRTALRSLAHNRRLKGIGPTPPYELQKSVSGNIVLHDPTTGKSLTLDAFGDANENDFAQLFAMRTERELP